ncbi:hypothetical protein TNCV_3783661 [Trichonephila clavipes]|nr:hypothetical protein TNCV_3783661 [Trichonephila clavipes]
MAVVPDFHKRILFSDEALFWLNGYVNKQNCRIWSEASPQVYSVNYMLLKINMKMPPVGCDQRIFNKVSVLDTRDETRGHRTTPLRVKEDIEDVSSELGNGY